MAINVSQLVAEVTPMRTAQTSFIQLFNTVQQQLKDALAGDPAAQAIVDGEVAKIIAAKDEIVAAMAANVTP